MLHTPLHIPSQTGRLCATPAAQVLEARIVNALGTVAQLVIEDPTYISVFERLEQELADIQTRNDAIERARKYLTKPL